MHDAISQALYRGCAAIDRGRYDWLDEVFRADAVIVAGPYEGPLAGFIAQLEARRATTPRASHMIGNILITPLDDDRAFVESYCHAVEQTAPESGPAMHRAVNLRYADLFERHGDDWRIARRTIVVDIAHPPVPLADSPSYRGPQGRRDAEDPALLLLVAAREVRA